MADTEGNRKRAALTVAIQAGTAAVAYGLKTALQDRGERVEDRRDEGVATDVPTPSAAEAAVLKFARRTVIPTVEDAALAVGKWVGKNAPDRVCNIFLEPFIEALNEQAPPARADR